ncbi:MAG: hypothetical protein AB8H79_09410 [Myxococcota bacterium]
MNGCAWLCMGLLAWVPASAVAAETPFYLDNAQELNFQGKTPTLEQLRFGVSQELSRGGVRVFRKQPLGPPALVRPDTLSSAELLALLAAMGGRWVGAEMDALVKDLDGQRVPVSVWWERKTRIVLQRGEPVRPTVVVPVSVEEIRVKYGLTSIIDRDRHWDAASLGTLDRALSALPAVELQRVRSVPFVREAQATDEERARLRGRSPSAVFRMLRSGPEIAVFDEALDASARFTGSPTDPKPVAEFLLLHEIAHALARASEAAWFAEDARLVRRQNELARRRNALLTVYKREVRAFRSAPSAQAQASLERQLKQIDDLAAVIEVATADSEAHRRTFTPGQRTPAARALMGVLGAKPAPTLYGRTSPEEAFADCFALFRLDKAALQRSAPKVLQWFEEGGHLRVE